MLAKPTSWVAGGEKQTWGLGAGRSLTKRALYLEKLEEGREKMGRHGRSGARADWSDDDYFTHL